MTQGLPDHPPLDRDLTLDDDAFVRQVMVLALGQGWTAPRPQRALALLQSRPQLAASRLPLALVQGDLAAVKRLHAEGRIAWPPLACAAASSLARLPAQHEGLLATVRWLLEQGADANTRWHDTADGGDAQHSLPVLPVLYGAVARAGCFEIVQALLDAGADPNDNESLYHATEQPDRRILAALVAAGARWPGTNALARQLDHDDLEGTRQCLQLGADPNEPMPGGGNALHHALQRGRGVAFLRLLVEHGCEPRASDSHGLTPAWHALLGGDTEALGFFDALGAGAQPQGHARFLAACAAGDETAARQYLVEHPGTLAALEPIALRLLPDQAQRGRLDAVRLMLQLGWPVDVRGDWQASAFNQAAFRGDLPMCRLLMDHGAHWTEPNGYGGDVRGSCLHAGLNQSLPGGDYAAVARLLVLQGAPLSADELAELDERVAQEAPIVRTAQDAPAATTRDTT